MIRFLGKLQGLFEKIVDFILMIAFSAIVLLVCAQVIVRFIGTNAVEMSWSEELVRYLLCYATFFGTVSVYIHHGHVWVANLVDAVPPVLRKVLLTLSYLVQIAFCAAIFYGSAQYLPVAATQTSAINHFRLDIVYSGIPITTAFTLMFCIKDLFLMLTGKGDTLDA